MLAFDPRSGEVRDFDLHAGDVFEAGNEVFLVTLSGDFSKRVGGSPWGACALRVSLCLAVPHRPSPPYSLSPVVGVRRFAGYCVGGKVVRLCGWC